MQRNATEQGFSSAEIMQVTGIFTVVFSLIMGALSLFVLPTPDIAVAGALLLFSGIFLVAGGVLWVVGKFKARAD